VLASQARKADVAGKRLHNSPTETRPIIAFGVKSGHQSGALSASLALISALLFSTFAGTPRLVAPLGRAGSEA
jgi:hypothetical protein